ncbi:hypothetical protein DL768_007821 [Monosporascus sp. mg162]|nr:hypothetical protein DL768_007821 [Monosporascus sp. mg162]
MNPQTDQLLASASAAGPTPAPALAPSLSPVPPPAPTATTSESGGRRVHGGDTLLLGDEDRDPASRLARDCRGSRRNYRFGTVILFQLLSPVSPCQPPAPTAVKSTLAGSATGQAAACGMEIPTADEFFTLLKEDNAPTAEDAGTPREEHIATSRRHGATPSIT